MQRTRSATNLLRAETKSQHQSRRGCSAGVQRVVLQDTPKDETAFYTEGLKELNLQSASLEREYQQRLAANRRAIQQLHDENNHLRAISAGTCDVTETELEMLEHRKFLAVRRLNYLTYQLGKMRSEIEATEQARHLEEKQFVISSKEAVAGSRSVVLRIQRLEKSLDNVMGQQKCVATITNGYRGVLQQMLDFNVSSEARVRTMEEDIEARRQDYARLVVMYNNAVSDHNYARDELCKFTEMFQQLRQKKDKALAEHRERIDRALAETERLGQHEMRLQHEIEDEYQLMEELEAERQAVEYRQKHTVSVMERLSMCLNPGQQLELAKEGASYDASPEDEERLRAYEESFRNMMHATESTTLDELITNCETEYGMQLQLQEQLRAEQQRLEKLKGEVRHMQQSLEEKKICGVAPPPMTPCLQEELATCIEDAVWKRDAAAETSARLQKLLAEVIRRVDVLGENLASYRPSMRVPPTRADNLVTHLLMLQKKIFLLADDAVGYNAPPTLVNPVHVSLPLSNTRVKLPHTSKRPDVLLQTNTRCAGSATLSRTVNGVRRQVEKEAEEECRSGSGSASIASGIVPTYDVVESILSESSSVSEDKQSARDGGPTVALLDNDEPLDREQIKRLAAQVLRREERRRQRDARR